MAKTLDMTEGKPLGLMIRFSVPLLISNALQMLFVVVDSAIVGRILGVNAFASIGVTASPHWLVFSAVIGINIGFGTLIAQRFGAKDMDGLRRAFVTAMYLSLAFGVAIGIGGVFVCRPLLELLATPPEIIDGAVIYLSWLWAGKPLVVLYNLLAMTLFSLGDSKTPLYAMIMASIVNIVLNLILIFPFGLAGVAAASLVAQISGIIFCAIAIRKTGLFKGCGKNFDRSSAIPLLKLALPLGFRNAVIEIGGLIMQRYINEYGTEFVAGMAAARRMYSFLMIGGGAIEASVGTFVAQNFGAGQLKRVKRGVRDGLKMVAISSIFLMAVSFPFGRHILSLFIDGDATQVTEVLAVGTRQLNLMTAGLPLLYLLFLYRAALQGLGNTVIPMISGFAELTMRIISVVLLTGVLGVWGIHLADPIGWPIAAILLISSYYIVLKRVERKELELNEKGR
ncbi:MAG: MATE family efflux transporter [Oscillospiraceae bacterium]|nr:MATE family efflux transporter [Oscillospiraceae bacterium]MCL2278774.1 MATE family efflux transporter [Oscillospiraceae bacterium]